MELKPSERLQQILNAYQYKSFRELATKTGILYQTINNITNDKINISFNVASKLQEQHPEIDKIWLITGCGEMIKTDKSITEIEELKKEIENLKKANEFLMSQVNKYECEISNYHHKIDKLLTIIENLQ